MRGVIFRDLPFMCPRTMSIIASSGLQATAKRRRSNAKEAEVGYVEESILAGERVVYRTTLHKIVFIWPVLFLLIAVLGAGWLFYLLAAVAGVLAYAEYTTSEFGVTNRRVLAKVGIISRRSLEILLTKVEGIGVNQGVFGRMFGYGTIVITGTGGTKEPFKTIAKPFDFRKHVQEQVAAVQAAK